MGLRILTISNSLRFLSFLIIASLFFIDFSFIFPENTVYNSNLYAQTAPGDITLYFAPESLSVNTGSEFSIPVKLDTSGISINAVQADITYPADLLEVVSIDDTASAFPLTVVKTGGNGNISIIRGSFKPVSGNNQEIATLHFKALASGLAPLDFLESSAAVNGPTDGLTRSPGIVLTISYPVSPSPSLSPSPTPLPSSEQASPSPTPLTSSTIKIYAAGMAGKNIYPDMRLDIKSGKSWTGVKTFKNIKGDINSRNFQEFTYLSKTKIKPSDIRVRFTNDWYKPGVGDRNLVIDRINLDGVDIQTEDISTYSQGSWSAESGCKAGFKKSEWLHCNGFFEYR